MSRLTALKQAETLSDLAHILDFSPKGLSFILYKIPDDKKYYAFNISKKNGGQREILAPEPRLKRLQRQLANVLNECIDELGHNDRVLSHGFRQGYSIHSNAAVHKNKRYVLNFDLENFFPSINFGRVRGFFIKNNDFCLNEKVATVISQISCHNNCLPQGSPCSPIISNLIANLLDIRLARIAKRNRCNYSRYADDITFSTNQKHFPEEIALQNPGNQKAWEIGTAIESEVTRSGFRINPSKTRLSRKESRQMVTGLVINNKVNVRVEYYKLARAMIHNLLSHGEYRIPSSSSPVDIPSSAPNETTTSELARLEGILGHIFYTRNISDHREKEDKQDNPSAIWRLYKTFLFYKHFGRPDSPLIICEGDTDKIYLKTALKRLCENHANLVQRNGDDYSFNIKFLPSSDHIRDVLSISGGTSPLAWLVGNYNKTIKKIPSWAPTNPVIILTDNDRGAKKVFSSVKTNSHETTFPTIDTNDDYYYINNNLYLIKTPHIGHKKDTRIEDLFEKKWLSIEIDGKTFNCENDYDTKEHYGKRIFAEKVVLNHASAIDFSNFDIIFDRLDKIIADYKSRTNSP